MLLTKDPSSVAALLVELRGDTDESLTALRDLARGIYPPLLAERGLAAALEVHARKSAVPVHLEAHGVDRYSQEVEAAVYFCVLEALQNVQKYATAGRVILRLQRLDDTLSFEVSDDGAGFDPATTAVGSGMQNMHDRLEALGGGSPWSPSSQPGPASRVRCPPSAKCLQHRLPPRQIEHTRMRGSRVPRAAGRMPSGQSSPLGPGPPSVASARATPGALDHDVAFESGLETILAGLTQRRRTQAGEQEDP